MLPRALILLMAIALPLSAQEAEEAPPPEPPMTLDRLNQIVTAIDPEAQSNGRVWHFRIAETEILIVTDPVADRMRAIAPVREAAGLSSEDLARMMQANFDAALDARYAIGQGTLWSAFIHPLASLEKNELLSGLGQVVNLKESYGSLYSGGALQYGGGDSEGLQRKLIDDLLKKGEEI